MYMKGSEEKQLKLTVKIFSKIKKTAHQKSNEKSFLKDLLYLNT